MAELAAWLERIGLGHYADAFAEAAIDLDVLPDLSEADLADIGVRLGDRMRLLNAIAAPVHDAGDAGAARSDGTLSWSPSSACQLTVMFVVVLADRRHDVAALDLAIAHPDFVDGLSTKRRPVNPALTSGATIHGLEPPAGHQRVAFENGKDQAR